MSSPHLPNYLRAARKRLALSQDDVAFLLGAESGAKVSRYERFAREPGLRTALACEALFHTPVSELFAGLYQTAEQEVAARARLLARKAEGQKPSTRRQAILAAIAAGGDSPPLHQ